MKMREKRRRELRTVSGDAMLLEEVKEKIKIRSFRAQL